MVFAIVAVVAMSLAAPPSAEQFYAQAIETMRNVPQPNYTTYDVHVHTSGLGFSITRGPDGKASIDMPLSRGADAMFSAAHRKSDDRTSVETAHGWAVIHFPLFDPTWNGVNDWIRYGPLNERPDSATALPLPAPVASGLPVIAAVSTMGIAFYNV